MKKIFAFLVFLIMIPAFCFAADPVIRSDTRTFNPLTGVYDLRGNVFVQFPVHENTLTITGDTTQVYLYKMEVHGEGNITLTENGLYFKCDKVDVYHSNSTAYVSGNIMFKQDDLNITSDTAEFCWKTKLAAFHGNVSVNGVKQPGNIVYHVIKKKFV